MSSRRERKIRQRRADAQQRNIIIVIGAVIVAVAAVVFILRSTAQARLPRQNRVSAATLNKGDGTDVCAKFPPRTGSETQPPPLTIDPSKDYAAWIVTAKGDIAVDLFANIAPQTVNSFMFLACTGFYDNVTFHRVVPGFVAQGGDPKGDGTGGPGYTIPDEFSRSDLKFDAPGWVSMAHTPAPDSAGSQFFITYAPAPNLDGSFTIFGQVVKGMDVVQLITPRDPSQGGRLPPGDKMQTIIVREVGPK